jgi:hypothetical protein
MTSWHFHKFEAKEVTPGRQHSGTARESLELLIRLMLVHVYKPLDSRATKYEVFFFLKTSS